MSDYELIRKYEGLKLKAYRCPAGIVTIGYGSTQYPDGRPVLMGDEINEALAEHMMQLYVEREIMPFVNRFYLTDYERAALISLCYNVGTPTIERDRPLVKALEEKDYKAIHLNWTYGYRNNLKGLRIRRAEELLYFMRGS